MNATASTIPAQSGDDRLGAEIPSRFRWPVIPYPRIFTLSSVLIVLQFLNIQLYPADRPFFILLSLPSLAISAYLLYVLFRDGHFLLFVFTVYFVYECWVTWVINFVFDIPFSLWRERSIAPRDVVVNIKYNILYITAYMAMIRVAIGKIQKHRLTENFKPYFRYSSKDQMFVLLLILSVATAAFAVYNGGFQVRESWLIDSDLQDRFILRFSVMLITMCYAVTVFSSDKLANLASPSAIVLSFAALVLALNGYRNVFVSFASLILIFYSMGRPLSLRQFLYYSFFGGLAVILLLIVNVTRNEQVGIGQLLSTNVLSYLTYNVVHDTIGAAQQMNLIAVDQIVNGGYLLHGLTYLQSAINVLPNSIRTEFIDTQYPQDYILEAVRFVIPAGFIDSGHNMGATVFVEGVLNFGRPGPIIASAGYIALFTWIEIKRFSGPVFYLSYLTLIGNAYMPAWYGSTNFMKMTIAYAVLAALWFGGLRLLRYRIALGR